MSNAFVQLPPDGAGKRAQTFENTVSGQVVEAQAVVLVDSTGAEKTASSPQAVTGNAASGASDAGNPVKVGGVFNTTLPTVTNGQRVDIQSDSHGRQIMTQAGVFASVAISITSVPGVQALDMTGYRSAAATFTGTWVATVVPQISNDGTDFVNTLFYNPATQRYYASLASGALHNGTYLIVGAGGAQKVQVNATVYASGTVIGTLSASLTDTALPNNQYSEGPENTYSSAVTGLVPAASATDVVAIVGSASKQVGVKRVSVSISGGAAALVDVQLIKRSTADSGGTSTQPTLVAHNTAGGTPAATAVVNAYTANPTTGASAGLVRSRKYLVITGTSPVPDTLVWEFERPVILNGVAESLCVNLNGVSITTGSMDFDCQLWEK